MEQTENISAVTFPDEASPSSQPAAPVPAARVSDRLAPALIEPALDAGRDKRPGRARRVDGWTPKRIRIFLNALADCGVVVDAARAAGMSEKSAYNLRNRTANRAFHLAWAAAEQLARRRISADVMSRAIHGCTEVIIRDGKVWGERHRFDNRLTMAVLARLDRQAEARLGEGPAVRAVAEEFDQFLDIVCDGGRGAARFIADRDLANSRLGATREDHLLECADNYARYGVGLPIEIDDSDLDVDEMATWTDDQRERARRLGLYGFASKGEEQANDRLLDRRDAEREIAEREESWVRDGMPPEQTDE